jgi:small subunit ribosomal protein S6
LHSTDIFLTHILTGPPAETGTTLMAENAYEAMFILDSNKYGRDPGGVSGQLVEAIEKAGGSILANRLWEERRLAYPIGTHRKGTYWLTYFKLDSGKLTELNREFTLNDNIVRSLVLKIEPRLVDVLVQHALAGPAAMRRAEPVAVEALVDDLGVGEEE